MKKRRILFISGLIIILIAISIVCFIFGRGHTVYFDNKGIEGTDYKSYESIEIIYKGETVTTLAKAERINITLTGQKLDIVVKYQKKRNSSEENEELYFKLPYNMDGIVINLPALLDGADIDTYMSEFIPAVVEEETEEVPNTDEFAIPTEE